MMGGKKFQILKTNLFFDKKKLFILSMWKLTLGYVGGSSSRLKTIISSKTLNPKLNFFSKSTLACDQICKYPIVHILEL
jgi:hypothetical protein